MADCRNCAGEGWVCENHLDMPWQGGDQTCCGGAGAPCPVCNGRMAVSGLLSTIATEARRYAGHYRPSSDGFNTFVMFADFVEKRAYEQWTSPTINAEVREP